jgi:hypothetical protein
VTDTVFVTGLAVHAYHGVMDHEATVGQTFRLDLVLDVDLSAASRSDKLAHTVGYDQIVNVASLVFCMHLPTSTGRGRGWCSCRSGAQPVPASLARAGHRA